VVVGRVAPVFFFLPIVIGLHNLWKDLASGGPYFEGHSFVSGGYVLAKEGIGKVCNQPEGMGEVFSHYNPLVGGRGPGYP